MQKRFKKMCVCATTYENHLQSIRNKEGAISVFKLRFTMYTFVKPTWWDELAAQYGFSNDGLPTISSHDLLQILTDNVSGHFDFLLSPSFLAAQTVVQDTSGSSGKPLILVAPDLIASEIIGAMGVDYLSGSTQDDILYGGANSDFFVPRGGVDLIIGSTTLTARERDTVSYEMAIAGITMDFADIPLPLPPASMQAYYSVDYDQWSAGNVLTITNFISGPGGDVINVYDLLNHIGYTGANPITDGYLRLSNISSGMKIQFDPDGKTGPTSATQAVIIKGLYTADFSVADNLVTSEPPPPPPPPRPADPSDYTLVSQDGDGGYDILYSIENIIGSKFADVIHGRGDSANLLSGGAGNDILYGEAGNDTLIGGTGDDILYGGADDDLFLMGAGSDILYGEAGHDTYKFSADYLAYTGVKSAIIQDFQTGPGGDMIDVSELLIPIRNSAINPLADGYISIRQGEDGSAEILFDRDGSGGSDLPIALASLNGVDASAFSMADNLVMQSPSIILTAVLGQSNASGLRVFADDSESGLTRLEDGLRSQTDFDKFYSVLRDENGYYIDTAIGGTVVNGDLKSDPGIAWWYPSSDKPGDLTIRAADILLTQIADFRSQGTVTPAVIWGQGESDAHAIGIAATPEERAALQQDYMNATTSVFNYILENVSRDIQFYIMQTGNFNITGAIAAGLSQETIDATVLGLTYIREAQEQLALAHENVHLAVNYFDLPMMADIPSTTPGYEATWATDQWHLFYDSREIVGDRLADFIAQDLGFDHVIDNPGAYPLHLLSDLTIHEGTGLVINGTDNDNIITGTTGDDIIHGAVGADAIVGGDGKDTLYGDAGADTMIGGGHADLFVFTEDTAFEAIDVIMDFSPAEGDLLDVSDLLGEYQQHGGDLSLFVQIVPDGSGNSMLLIDRDGAGNAYAPVQIALLSGVENLTNIDAFVKTGNVSSPPPPPPPPPSDPFAPTDDFVQGSEDTPITGNVLADNGTGPDQGTNLSVLAGIFASAQGGTIELLADGSFVYTPVTNYNGLDSFTYTVMDDAAHTADATVYITVDAVNDAPTAGDDSFTVFYGQSVSGNLIDGTNAGEGADTDVDGDILTVTTFSALATSGATVLVSADGSFSYTALDDYIGTDSFTYTVSDGTGETDTATVTLNILIPAGATIGTDGDEELIGTNSGDFIFALGGDDTVLGRNGKDMLYGGSGDDYINGGGGNDTLYGGAGDDILQGGKGSDILHGGKGHDILFGDSGADLFLYGADILDDIQSVQSGGPINLYDIIGDFQTGAGRDVIDISDLLQAAGFTGADPVAEGYVSVTQQGLDTIISLDTDGSGGAQAAVPIAQLLNTDSALFDLSKNLVVEKPIA